MASPRARTIPPAVLLGGGAIAVSVARCLANVGVSVYALGDASWDTVRHSRHCTAFIDLGSGAGVQERWLGWLESGPRGAVLIPCSDDAVELIGRNRASLREWGYAPVEGNDDVSLAMLNKQATYVMAGAAGVPAPRTVAVLTVSDLEAVHHEIGYPCALKPVHSHVFARHFGVGIKAFVAQDEEAMRQAFNRVEREGLLMLATEIIPGGDERFCSLTTYIDVRGEALVCFTKSKIRQYPIHFGLGSYAVTDWNPEVAQLGLDFCRYIGLRGIAVIEFKRDTRDDELKLIECNARLTLNNALAYAAGINLPMIAHQCALGRRVPRQIDYRKGLYLWFPVEDVRALIAYRRQGELTVRAWARSLLHRQHFPIFAWTDPFPALATHGGMLRRALPKLIARAVGVRKPRKQDVAEG